MADLILLEELAAYLNAEEIGSTNLDAPVNANVATIWINPRDGSPEPRRGERGTITVSELVAGIEHSVAPWVDVTIVEIEVRAYEEATAKLIHRAIRDLLAPVDSPGGRKQWYMNDLLVEQSALYRGEQEVGRSPTSYDRNAAFEFWCRRKSLAGQPYAP